MKNFFKGISLSSIAAGALAAVTSFLLSAKIGIAGSVIGVAIGSIVSAVSSQIYQNVLHESGRKLQDVAGTTGDEDDGATETVLIRIQPLPPTPMRRTIQRSSPIRWRCRPPHHTSSVTVRGPSPRTPHGGCRTAMRRN